MKVNPTSAIAPEQKEFDAVHEGTLDFSDGPPMQWKARFPIANLFTYTIDGISAMESVF